MAMTRRKLLNAMARLGGPAAVYETLAAWDFLKPPPAMAADVRAPKDSGGGRTVAILGAGVAGLCAAYELDRAGYECVDSRSHAPRRRPQPDASARRRVNELGGAVQECRFDDGL